MKLTRHLAGYLPANLASAIASFGGVYVFTRLLGAEDYGRYALMFAVMALIHTVTLAPAEAAAYRFTASAQAAGKMADHFHTVRALMLRSLGIAALVMIALSLAVAHLPDYLALLPWIALLLPLNTLLQTTLEAHRARQQVGRYVAVFSGRLLGGFLLGALIAWLGEASAAAPFIGLVIAAALLALPEAAWLMKSAKGGVPDAGRRKQYMAYGLPIAAALGLDLLLSAADRFLIALFLGEASVGAYAAGYGVADKTVLLLCAWAAMAGSPLVMAAYEAAGPDAAREQARGLVKTMLLIGLPAAAGLALVARPLAEALIGEEVRAGAIRIIPWIAFAGLMNGLLIHYYSEAFQLARKTGERALLMLIPAGVNIAANLVLIPRFGLTGAVIATVVSYGLGLIILALRGRRYVALPLPVGDLARVILASLSMWPVIALVPDFGSWPELIAKACAGGVTYMAVALLLDAGGARSFMQDRRGTSSPAQAS
ncbi:lipopolysaccharide biosynthesis protein [Henriciella aquimarina]|uniref:lipopolysaccharide biosynthesis protein n=1 Tax=Henriciella aquimarina TaxID=545261 RepID=UPI0009FEB664|nr:lipopolysaccharide biosynthesis protein [Henriciella aquimarina]